MKARNKATGGFVSADEATLRRLGPGWEIVKDEPSRADEKKPARRRKPAAKSDEK